MKILITGASGLVGHSIFSAAAADPRFSTVVGTVFTQNESVVPVGGRAQLTRVDLCDAKATRALTHRLSPDVIVNAAAISSPGDVVQSPRKAHQLNCDLPELLAAHAKKSGCWFVHLSSDMVFDGQRGNYDETDPTNPTEPYGRQKLEAEDRALNTGGEQTLCLRIPIVNGNSPGGRRSIHEKLLRVWSQDQATPLFEDEVRQPCSATSIAALILAMLALPQFPRGLLHWAGSDTLTRLEMGRRIARRFGLSEQWIQKTKLKGNPQFSNRPHTLTFNTTKAMNLLAGKLRPLSYDAQLKELRCPPDLQGWLKSQTGL